jgi:hypothetical protein
VGDPSTWTPELSEIAKGTSGVPTGYCMLIPKERKRED